MMMRGADVEDGEDNDGGRYDGEGLLHQDDGNLVPGVDATAIVSSSLPTHRGEVWRAEKYRT